MENARTTQLPRSYIILIHRYHIREHGAGTPTLLSASAGAVAAAHVLAFKSTLV